MMKRAKWEHPSPTQFVTQTGSLRRSPDWRCSCLDIWAELLQFTNGDMGATQLENGEVGFTQIDTGCTQLNQEANLEEA
jgi:hypothetical protein